MTKQVEITFVVDVDDDVALFEVAEAAAATGVVLQEAGVVRRVLSLSTAVDFPDVKDWRG